MIRLLPGLSLLGSDQLRLELHLLNRTWAEAGVRATWNLVNLAAGPSTIDAAGGRRSRSICGAGVALSIAATCRSTSPGSSTGARSVCYDSADALNDIEGKLPRAVANA